MGSEMCIRDSGDTDSSGISSSTRLPVTALQDPATDLALVVIEKEVTLSGTTHGKGRPKKVIVDC